MNSLMRGLAVALLLAMVLPMAGCNKGADKSGSGSANSVQDSPSIVAETPTPRETTGGNTPPVKAPQPAAVTDFSYTTFDGNSSSISAMAGKPLVVNLWAVW